MRVIVTRPRTQATELARRIEELGHDVVLCPLTAIEPLGDEPVDPSGYDWLVVTSPNGANELARRLTAKPSRVAAIGPGTAAALRAGGIEPALVPGVSTQEGLLADLPRPAGRVLFAGAEAARRVLVEELGADFLPLYRTVELVPEELPSGDVVVLASASAARAWGRLGLDVPAISIGPQTTKAALEAGIDVALEAEPHDVDGLVEALRRLG
jgi:uroporphyrinogen III methyltransferase/synthase